jgi:hypothetical protein
MKKLENSYTKDRTVVANAVEILGVTGRYTTDDLAEWEVPPERIVEVQRTHSSCIPLAMSGWSETVPLPTTWAIWWISRVTHAKHQSECGMGG